MFNSQSKSAVLIASTLTIHLVLLVVFFQVSSPPFNLLFKKKCTFCSKPATGTILYTDVRTGKKVKVTVCDFHRHNAPDRIRGTGDPVSILKIILHLAYALGVVAGIVLCLKEYEEFPLIVSIFSGILLLLSTIATRIELLIWGGYDYASFPYGLGLWVGTIIMLKTEYNIVFR